MPLPKRRRQGTGAADLKKHADRNRKYKNFTTGAKETGAEFKKSPLIRAMKKNTAKRKASSQYRKR
jgi:hypothetical protein